MNAPLSDSKLPQVFGRYLLIRRLSRGGMGEIFLAKCGQLTGFEKLCVIKKILPNLAADREFIRRFIDEAQVAIKLSHANIATVFEVGMVEGEYFLALEYVEGRDIRRIQTRLVEEAERLSTDLALLVVREVASGLAYAHRRVDERDQPINLVHCDISPPNVIVSFEGEVKIIDFGIAKSAIRISETNPSVGFGKFGYMAPEQLVRGGVVDRRTDVYAAGVLLYELLTGRRMFQFPEGADYRAMARMVTHGQHPRPSEHDAELASLDDVIMRAVAPAPGDRYATAEELRDAVQMALVRVNPTSTPDRLGAQMRTLFAEEMLEERFVLQAANATDLSAFADEMTGARTHTVSFALHADVTGSSAAVAPAADGENPTSRTQLVGRLSGSQQAIAAGRRWWPILAVLAAMFLVAGVAIGLALTKGGDRASAKPAPAPQAQASSPPIIVQPIAPAPAPAAPTPTTPAAAAAATTPPDASKARPPRQRPTRSEPPANPPVASTADVQAKVKAVGREYTEFKRAYGPRLDAEWNDILSLATFSSGEDKVKKLDAKLDSFRKRMAQVKNE